MITTLKLLILKLTIWFICFCFTPYGKYLLLIPLCIPISAFCFHLGSSIVKKIKDKINLN